MSVVVDEQGTCVRAADELQSSLVRHFDFLAGAPGGVAQLRALVLALAVRGKLVSQNPKDEPASRLLDRIRAVRESTTSAGQGRRSTALPSVGKEEERYPLPSGWAWTRIGELGQVVGGGTPKSDVPEYWADAGVPWLTPADLYGWREMRISRGRRDISQEGLAASSARVLPAGTVLFSSRAPIGYVAIAGAPLATNQGFKSCVPYVSGLSEYLYWHLKQLAPVIDAAASGTTFKEISGADFARLVIALPPINEQARIVARVDELMRLCDALEAKGRLEAEQHARLLEAMLRTLIDSTTPDELAAKWQRVAGCFNLLIDRPEAVDTLEQTVLQLAVRGLLVPQDSNDVPASVLIQDIRAEKDRLIASAQIKRDKPLPPITVDEEPFELPVGWAWATLDSLALQITDGAHHTPNYVQAGVPFLSVKDLRSGTIDFSDTRFISSEEHRDLAKRCNPEFGDLLLTKIGTTGIAVVVDTTVPFSLFVSVALIKLPSVSAHRDYLSLVINSPFVRQQSEDGTEGVGNKNLVLRKIRAFQIPLPPLNEQTRIVARVTELRRLCADLRQRLSRCSATQAALADALVDHELAA